MSGLERSALARMSTAQFRDAREEARGADESADAVSIDEEEARSKATLRTHASQMVFYTMMQTSGVYVMAAYVSARSSDVDMHVGVLTAVCWLWTWLQEELYVQGEALGLDEETVRDAVEAFDGDYAVRHTPTPIGICRSSRRDDEQISRKSCLTCAGCAGGA